MNLYPSTYSLAELPATLLAARQREVETALLVQALCGCRPTLVARAQLQRYVVGELNREQAFAALYAGLG